MNMPGTKGGAWKWRMKSGGADGATWRSACVLSLRLPAGSKGGSAVRSAQSAGVRRSADLQNGSSSAVDRLRNCICHLPLCGPLPTADCGLRTRRLAPDGGGSSASSTSTAATTTRSPTSTTRKWGIDYGDISKAQVLGKIRKLLGPSPGPWPRSLEIGAGTGYFTLNLMMAGLIENAVCTDVSPGMLKTLDANAEKLGFDRARRPSPTPPRCRSRTRASTSSSATPSSTTCPTSTRPGRSSPAC